jgi:hypothetical protein
MYRPSKKEFDLVIKLEFDDKIKYFIDTVCFSEEICVLCNNDGYFKCFYDTEGIECLPVWPAKEYAKKSIVDSKIKFENCYPKNIVLVNLHEFLEKYLCKFREDNIHMFVFYTCGSGALFTADTFNNMLCDGLNELSYRKACTAIHPKEFESVIHADIHRRTKNFINIVCDCCYMWLCSDNNGNFLLYNDVENKKVLPVWPARQYAEWSLTKTKMKKYSSVTNVQSMGLHKFLYLYINELIKLGIHICIFPAMDEGTLITAESFKNMMQEELARIE